MQETWIFTFGYSHKHANKFIRLHGDYESTRQKMFDTYGDNWAFQYPCSKLDELLLFGLTELKDSMESQWPQEQY